jgi:aminoglycoside phosphotransferase (APT) family kinase protein
MEPSEVQFATDAGRSVASELGLRVDDAVVVHNSNRIAVHLTPCDVLARIAPLTYQTADDDLELMVAHGVARTDSPAAEPDPRVEPRIYSRDGFAVTLWTYYEPVASSEIEPGEYANTLARLHTGLRQLEMPAPHFTNRIREAQMVVADREWSPELGDADRELVRNSLGHLSTAILEQGAHEQLLHGEPHLGNLLRTSKGLLFIDFETCCFGPVEFDIAHCLGPSEDGHMLAAEAVCENYPGTNPDLIDQCRILILAMITAWRWRRDDQLPNGPYWALEGLNLLRAELPRYGLGVSSSDT